MPRRKFHRERVYQVAVEPGRGSVAVGYVRYSSEMQDPATIATQKRVISEFAEKKGWRIVRWYEEPEQSAKYEEVEARPVFAQLFRDAEAKQFQVVLCYVNNRWSRNTALTLVSLSRLRKLGVWWATADGLWDINKAQQDGIGLGFVIDTQMG
ncbi:MAG: recombinase family protein, partial [Ktedonobacteraceae bacterium]